MNKEDIALKYRFEQRASDDQTTDQEVLIYILDGEDRECGQIYAALHDEGISVYINGMSLQPNVARISFH